MTDLAIQKAALHFGVQEPVNFSSLSSGLIHQTYHVWDRENPAGVVLQQINKQVFQTPQQIVENYCIVYEHLRKTNTVQIPEPLRSRDGKWLWVDEVGNSWRANAYVVNSYTENTPITALKANHAARSFGQLTQALSDLDPATLVDVLPGFHHLGLRYDQFLDALRHGMEDRLKVAKNMIEALGKRKHYVDFYANLSTDDSFKKRIMHHDCKLSNVLFNKQNGDAIGPIDLDTLMPGYYFSDLGDMVRSMSASVDETERDVDKLFVRKEVYRALIEGYLEGMGTVFTQKEKRYLHHSGLLMIYMQALRFLSDYLQGDVYYKTRYATQNYDRAFNQLTLLTKLEIFVQDEYQYAIQE
jgi:Ser/Thr protein kinase RdoA (MazF antagonist)